MYANKNQKLDLHFAIEAEPMHIPYDIVETLAPPLPLFREKKVYSLINYWAIHVGFMVRND